MNHLTVLELSNSRSLPERRRSDRYKVVHLLAITDRGTGQIGDIGREGLAFGCLYPHKFPESWVMDILDAKGSHIKQLRVRKIWERTIGHPDLPAKFELEIGVEFIEITPAQEDELDYLLSNLDLLELQYPSLL